MDWAIETAPNPAVLRVHTTVQLTARTIETCPPKAAAAPLDRLPTLEGIRTVDLHRYHARVNLLPGADPGSVVAATAAALRAVWGVPLDLSAHAEELPRAFAIDPAARVQRERVVAESEEMARSDPVARALFGVVGVAEAIVGGGLALVRLGRLFAWRDVEPAVRAALIPPHG